VNTPHRFSVRPPVSTGALAALVLTVGAAAQAQLVTGFEAPDYSASAAGTVLSGQQGWFLPPVAGSIDVLAYTYAGNALSTNANPRGGDQFIAGRSLGGTSFARAQHLFTFNDPAGVYTATYDFNGNFNGTLPAAENLGSWSLQDSAVAAFFQSLFRWDTHTADASAFSMFYRMFDATGIEIGTAGVGQAFGPQWTNLPVNHWFRSTTTFNVITHAITQISITDLSTCQSTVVDLTNAYLAGGANSTLPPATAVRFFTGGGLGNIMNWDNFSITTGGAAAPCRVDMNCDGQVNVADFLAFLQLYAAGDPRADLNGGGVNVSDFLLFLQLYSAGC
jgi:hypothetical protein